MIKKLRYRFIFVTMACISFIFVLILCVINISMTLSSRSQGYALLYRLSGNTQNTPDRPSDRPGEDGPAGKNPAGGEDGGGSSRTEQRIGHPVEPVGGFDAFRSFSVLYDSNNRITDIFFHENSDFTEDEIRALAIKVIDTPKERGVISRYLFLVKKEGSGTRIYFLDYSMEKALSLRLFWICLFIGLIGILFIFILVFFLSRWMILPVQTAFEKQKQFIADASHELKTPLTIITTNAEVLSASLQNNKWLNHILAQTNRMSTLIRELLELARLDSGRESQDFLEFNMSTAVKNTALSFESMAYEYGKTYEINIMDNILLAGNENGIKQLTTILLDNAFKYSDDRGKISISLSQHGDKKILTIENTGKGIAKEEQTRIFERFYRSDSSRSRESGGYGLGLSIASSIVQTHRGNIQVKSDEQSHTKFIVTF